jgi:hypothetical protein
MFNLSPGFKTPTKTYAKFRLFILFFFKSQNPPQSLNCQKFFKSQIKTTIKIDDHFWYFHVFFAKKSNVFLDSSSKMMRIFSKKFLIRNLRTFFFRFKI